jgi:integrase
MILLAYQHGLRATELCDLRWDEIDFTPAGDLKIEGSFGACRRPSTHRRIGWYIHPIHRRGQGHIVCDAPPGVAQRFVSSDR